MPAENCVRGGSVPSASGQRTAGFLDRGEESGLVDGFPYGWVCCVR
ncbi:hypothetical protein ACFOG5_01505 [Pedobacter fastidiosus]